MNTSVSFHPSIRTSADYAQFKQNHPNCELSYKMYDGNVVVRCAYHASLIVVAYSDKDFRIVPKGHTK